MFSIIQILLITLIDRRSDTLSLMHIDYYGVASLTILLELHNIQVGIQMAKGMNQNILFSMKNKNGRSEGRFETVIVWLEKVIYQLEKVILFLR